MCFGNPDASRVLRKLSREEAFYFFTSIGNYTGQSASSLEEFLYKIRQVDIKSLEFHHQRGDFEKWFAQTLEDKELASQVNKIGKLLGQNLKEQLHLIVSKRFKELHKGEG